MASYNMFVLLLTIFSLVNLCLSTPLVGVIQLDSYSFNKTLSGFQYTLVKFDKGFPHGDHHTMWGELARELRDVSEILVAEVRVKEYGDKANQELAARFGFNDREQFPEVILFKRDGSGYEEVRYGAPMEKDELLTFLKHKTGVYLNLPGCLRKFDSMASWFLRAEDAAGRAQVIARAKEDANKETDEGIKAKAKKYVKLMQMIDVKGEEALEAEKERVEKLIKEENMSEGKREDMMGTLNVIKSFERLRDPRERREDDRKEILEAKRKAEEEGDSKDEL